MAVAVRAGQRQIENQHIIDTINHYYSHLEIKPVASFTIESIMNKDDFVGRDDELKKAYNMGSSIKSLIN